jgi:hypothetical protein
VPVEGSNLSKSMALGAWCALVVVVVVVLDVTAIVLVSVAARAFAGDVTLGGTPSRVLQRTSHFTLCTHTRTIATQRARAYGRRLAPLLAWRSTRRAPIAICTAVACLRAHDRLRARQLTRVDALIACEHPHADTSIS